MTIQVLTLLTTNIAQICILFIVLYTVSSIGKVTYSEVITFLQSEPIMVAKYMSITTSCNKSLALSGNHLVYARKYSTDELNTM